VQYAHVVVVGSLLLGLVGCGGPLNEAAFYGGASTPHVLFSTPGPNVIGCGGSGEVRVQPCPVTLTKNRSMVDVAVSGPNVVSSAIKTNQKNQSGCANVCGVGQLNSNPLEYYVYAGTTCGTVTISFYGYNQSGGIVGIGKLKVINKDC